MAEKQHRYEIGVTWTGNKGKGTTDYRVYTRDYDINAAGKSAPIKGSSDPAFLGDTARYNPEEMLVASLSACHMLWYLHLCAVSGVVVTAYEDEALGEMVETKGGSGHFAKVTLRPRITITKGSDKTKAMDLHEPAHEKCFIANSVNFKVATEPTLIVDAEG